MVDAGVISYIRVNIYLYITRVCVCVCACVTPCDRRVIGTMRVLRIPGDIGVWRARWVEVVVGPIAVVSVCGASTVWRGWGDSTTTNDDDENIPVR